MGEDPVDHRASNFDMHPEDLWTLLNADSESVVLGGVELDLRFCISVALSNSLDVASPWTTMEIARVLFYPVGGRQSLKRLPIISPPGTQALVKSPPIQWELNL